jgi:transposase-like protein
MLVRLNGNGYAAAELHALIINEVRNEYQHNVTQQIYVSERAWSVIRRIKEDTLSVVTNSVKALPADASGLDLGKMILNHLSRLEENPYDIATNMMRKDLEDLF